MTDQPNKAELSDEIVERIKPLLAGQGPDMQGSVLADLTAIWLSGFIDREFRAAAFNAHLTLVDHLTALYDEQRGKDT